VEVGGSLKRFERIREALLTATECTLTCKGKVLSVRAVKARVGVEVWPVVLLSCARRRCLWSWRSVHLKTEETYPNSPLVTGGLALRKSIEVWIRRQMPCLYRESSTGSWERGHRTQIWFLFLKFNGEKVWL